MFRMNAKRWAAVLGVSLAGAVFADLPRLPPELRMVQGEESPGVVAFRHDSHVDAKAPTCTGCHPRLFSILGRSAETRRDVIQHATMEKGQSCGACHGKQAFGFDDCEMCHAK
jgi:c(7)-type cytochrome triheme protein